MAHQVSPVRFCNARVWFERGVSDISLTSHHSPLPSEKPLPYSTRDRYPFLDEPDCPVEMHALVGRRISMFHEYSKLYPQLREAKDLKELSEVCGKLLAAYIDNQQCFRELDYYLKHRRVLGRHPFLRNYKQIAGLRAKTTRQLMEERKRTLDNIWRADNEIRKGDKPHLNAQRRQRIEQYRLKLQEIDRLLAM